MRFEHLADVHARRHAQRIQHDVDRRAVGEVRHVFDRNDERDDALVAVTAGHLVARLHAALHREIHLDHLEHARGEIVAGRDLRASSRRGASRRPCAAPSGAPRPPRAGIRIFVFEADLEPRLARHVIEVRVFDLRAALELVRTAGGDLADAACRARARTSRPRGCAAGRPSPCAPARSRPSRSTAHASPSRRRRA